MSARCRYHSAAALPTRLDVATSTRPLILSGWSIATLIATVPPREKPAMSARSTPIESMSATRSVPSWRSVPLPRPAVVSPCPLRSYSTTRWCSIRSGNVRRHALWSSARPSIKIRVSPRPASNHATSMSLQRARMFTQHLAVHLARARQGKLVQADDPLRPLVPGQPALLEKSVELLLCQVPDDESDRDLAEVGVWPPDNADVYHRWMCPQHRLDLVRVDVGAAPDDDVLDPAGHVQISRVVDEAEVAHVRPAVGRVGTEFLAPVAILHEVASHTDFSNAAADSVGRWAFEDLPLCAIVRPPHRGPAKSLRVGGARHSKLAGVHRAVEARDRNAGRGLPTLRDLRGQRRAGDRNRAQRPRCAKRVVEHPDHVGRHADQHGSPRPVCDVETMLGSPVRLAKHDKSCAHAKTVKAHAADALGEGRDRKHAIVLRDLESRREALEGFTSRLEITEQDRVLPITPLTQGIGGMCLYCLRVGAALVMLHEAHWTPEHCLDVAAQARATVMVGVPTNVIRMLNQPLHVSTSLRAVAVAGAPLPPEVAERWERTTGVPISSFYGSMDAGQLAVASPSDPQALRWTTVGRPHDRAEWKILDGEICMRGDLVQDRYWGET